jgi:hypothetical protein
MSSCQTEPQRAKLDPALVPGPTMRQAKDDSQKPLAAPAALDRGTFG